MNAARESLSGTTLEQGFRLGNLEIDPAAGGVSGPGGCGQLDPKVMDVLVFLARHAGQVVTREDLLARVWPDTVVTDYALSRSIYELRRQLCLAGGDEQFKGMVETLPKRGYRLHGEVTWLPAPVDDPSRSSFDRRLVVLGIGAAAAALLWLGTSQWVPNPPAEPPLTRASSTMPSIAVLPFVDMSEGQDQQYLSDGITEEILDRLAKSGQLRVIARTSSFAFRGQSVDIPGIAARLNVSHVLEGSVRRSEDRVRIAAQLVDTSSNSHIWSETYDRALGDLFVVQDEIATSVAGALQVALAGTTLRGKAPASAVAYERFLQGEFFYNRRAPGDIERSVKYFQEALAIDPDYARAWAALAGAYALLHWNGGPSAKASIARQGEAAHRAVELDPDLAVGHARLAQYYFDMSDRQKARKHLEKAKALDPEDLLVLAFSVGMNKQTQDVEEAIARQRRLVAVDPLAVSHRINFGNLLVRAGRLDEALSEFHRVQELRPDTALDVEFAIARILVLQRRDVEAYVAIARLADGTFRDRGLALLHSAPDRRAEADAALRRLAARPVDTMNSIGLAEAYAFRGKHDEAFASLQDARQVLERDETSAVSRVWHLQEEMAMSPILIPLHGDARWKALMAD